MARLCSIPAFYLTSLSALAITLTAHADSNVDPANKVSWSENCGWMNWYDSGSPTSSQGVSIDSTGRFLSGFVWCENIGFLNLGDGSPANGLAYDNSTGADSGVNVDVGSGNLSGLAWGENVGWINLSTGALSGNAARLSDTSPRRLLGYAWAENIGWINLDLGESGKFVALDLGNGCDSTDFNGDGLFPDTADIDDFLNVFAGGACASPNPPQCNADIDYNNDTLFPDILDIQALLSVFSGGPCLR